MRISEASSKRGRGVVLWLWLAFGLLLALSLTVTLASGDHGELAATIAPSWWLPLLSGWIALSLGARARVLWLLLSAIAVVDFVYEPFSAEMFRLEYGIWGYAFFAAGAAQVLNPQTPRTALQLRSWWRWSLAASIVFILAAGSYIVALVDGDDGWLHASPAAAGALLVLASAVRWRATIAERIARDGTIALGLELLAVSIVATGLVFSASMQSDDWPLHAYFGLAPRGLALALCLAAAVSGWLRVRALVAALLLAFVAAWAFAEHTAQVVRMFIDPVSVVLLGSMMARWQIGGDAIPAASWRNLACLVAILALQFLGNQVLLPPYAAEADELVLGGVAFAGALIWRMRGLVAIPLMILLVSTLSFATDSTAPISEMASSLVRYGIIVFPYALAGLLASGYDRIGNLFAITSANAQSRAGAAQ